MTTASAARATNNMLRMKDVGEGHHDGLPMHDQHQLFQWYRFRIGTEIGQLRQEKCPAVV
jgi:hypothetical protein